MALTAPPSSALLIIELIFNLLVRHNTCRTLAHRDSPCDLEGDPYLPDEPDIGMCRATESSLWEIKVCEAGIYIIYICVVFFVKLVCQEI